MSDKTHPSIIFIVSATIILAVNSDSFAAALALIGTLTLYAFTEWLKVKTLTDSQKIKDELGELRSKVDNILIGKSLGR